MFTTAHKCLLSLPLLSMPQVASHAGLAVPQPVPKGSGLQHVQDIDVALKAQQAERVAQAAAEPAGVST